MRRGLAALVMGLSLMLATASWAGFILSRTVLDPGTSERLADQLLENPEVRATITARIGDAIENEIPPELRSDVDRPAIDLVAETALDDPRVEEVVRDGIVQAHQNALNGIDEPVTIDATAVGAAVRDAAVQMYPELNFILPQAPPLPIELPNTGLAWLGSVKDVVDRFTLLGGLVSLAGVTLAFWLARNRAAALRRVAFWAFAASAFWILVAFGVPAVLESIAPSSVAIATAAIDVFFRAMIGPAVTLAAIGLALLILSLFWPWLARTVAADRRSRRDRREPGIGRPIASRRPAPDAPQPANAGGVGMFAGPRTPRPAGPPIAATAQTVSGPIPGASGVAGISGVADTAPRTPLVTNRSHPRPPDPPSRPDKTQSFPTISSKPVSSSPAAGPYRSDNAQSSTVPSEQQVPLGEADTIEAETQPPWVPGVGYVDDKDKAAAAPRAEQTTPAYTAPANPPPANPVPERTASEHVATKRTVPDPDPVSPEHLPTERTVRGPSAPKA